MRLKTLLFIKFIIIIITHTHTYIYIDPYKYNNKHTRRAT